MPRRPTPLPTKVSRPAAPTPPPLPASGGKPARPKQSRLVQGSVGNLAYTVTVVRDRRFKKLCLDQVNFDVKLAVKKGTNQIQYMKDHMDGIYEVIFF